MIRTIFLIIFMAVFMFPGLTFSQKDTLTIVIDENGKVVEISDEGKALKFENGEVIDPRNRKGMSYQSILNKIYEIGKTIVVQLQTTESMPNYAYVFDVSKEQLTLESIPVFIGQSPVSDIRIWSFPIKEGENRIKLGEKTLSQAGVRYKITVTRYDSEDDRLRNKKDKSAVIFEQGFETYARYYLGMNIGVLFPFNASTDYGLLYNDPDDTKPIITGDENYEIRMLIYGSIYPWGYEPGKPISRNGFKRLHFDLGTELSTNIFKKIYIGIGYNLSRHFSLSLFACLGNVGRLKEGFKKDAPVNPGMGSAPLKYEFRPTFGIAVSLPFDIAKNWLGGVLGIK
jgi:hypothetical protein